jgi:aminoglycoside 6'-N-acetyltransferase I
MTGDVTKTRFLRDDEIEAWARMRMRLWPDIGPDDLENEMPAMLRDRDRNAVIVATDGEELIGFVEAGLRAYAEGCATSPVGFVEGWYVEPEHRERGVGRALIAAAERWALERGCTEMGSDVELPNIISQQAHERLGYQEVVRLVAYMKRLGSGS